MARPLRGVATAAAFVVLALAVWQLALPEFRLDDSFITYRVARNVARGLGFAYNPGERRLVTTAPLFALALAAGARLGLDVDLLARLVGALSIGLGGFLLYAGLPTALPRSVRLWPGIAYVLATPLWLSLGMETAPWMAAVLLAAHCARASRWGAAGGLVALAILTRPDAIVVAALLGFAALRAGREPAHARPLARYAMALVPILVLAATALLVGSGGLAPSTLAAKRAQASFGITGLGVGVGWWDGLASCAASLFRQSGLYALVPGLACLGAASRQRSALGFVSAWALLHLVGYAVLGVAPYRWYYVALVPAVVLAAALGLDTLRLALPRRAWPALVLLGAAPLAAETISLRAVAAAIREGAPADPALPVVDWDVYRRAGLWLKANAPEDAQIGVAETGQLGYYSERRMTDYLGLLQSDGPALLERRDLYSWLVGRAPEFLVFQRFSGRPRVLYGHVIEHDAWFAASYAAVATFDDPRYPPGPVEVMRRRGATGPFEPQSAPRDFGALRLTGLASDAASVGAAGGPLRLRLDWQVLAPAPARLHVAIRLLGLRGDSDGDYETGRWSGSLSTFHGLVVGRPVRSGAYPIRVAVGPAGGPYDAAIVGELRLQTR